MNGTTTDYGLIFDNFQDFAEDFPNQAKELLDNVEEGDWQNDAIYYYASPDDYADYQVREGWYASIVNCDLAVVDYHGAPSLYDAIDFDELGQDLIDLADRTCVFATSKNEVIETGLGWKIK